MNHQQFYLSSNSKGLILVKRLIKMSEFVKKCKKFLYLKKFWKLCVGSLLQVLKLGLAPLADQKVCLGSTRQKGGSVASLPILQCKLKNYSIFSNGATDLALLQICLYAAELLENWLYKITWWDEDPRVTFLHSCREPCRELF